jgi:uncharacterized RDD family membrane protein YckC
VVIVPAVVGVTTPGRELAVFFDGLLMTVLMFGLPCQIFVVVNRRELTALARSGLLCHAVVSRAELRGQPGKAIVDVAMDLACADGSVAFLRVSGLPTLPSVGAVYGVLVDPARPLVAGVIAPPVGIYIASVQRTGERVRPGEESGTRERVMEYADIWLRSVAAIIDLLLLLVAAGVIGVFTRGITASGLELLGLWLGIAFTYYVVMEVRYGWTIGKRVLGLRVVMLEGGGPLSWQASIVRNLLRIVDGLGCYLVAVIAVLMSDKKQRIGDRVAGTVVIRAPKNIDTGSG